MYAPMPQGIIATIDDISISIIFTPMIEFMLTCTCGKPAVDCNGGHSKDAAPVVEPVINVANTNPAELIEEYDPITPTIPSAVSAPSNVVNEVSPSKEVAVDNIPKRGDIKMETGSQTGYAVSGVSPWGYSAPTNVGVTSSHEFSAPETALFLQQGHFNLANVIRDAIERRQDVAELRAEMRASNDKVSALSSAFQAAETGRLNRELAQAEQKSSILEIIKAVTPVTPAP